MGPNGAVWRAPEVRDPGLGELLLRVDRAPLRSLPAAWSSKSVLLDREVRLTRDAAAGRVDVRADLELRLYGPAPSAFLRESVERRGTHVFLDTTGGLRSAVALPAGSDAKRLLGALHELLPLARHVGLLRWVEAVDPAGFRRLARELGEVVPPAPARPGAVPRIEGGAPQGTR